MSAFGLQKREAFEEVVAGFSLSMMNDPLSVINVCVDPFSLLHFEPIAIPTLTVNCLQTDTGFSPCVCASQFCIHPYAFCNIRKINCLEVYIYIILTLNRPHSSRGEESDLL